MSYAALNQGSNPLGSKCFLVLILTGWPSSMKQFSQPIYSPSLTSRKRYNLIRPKYILNPTQTTWFG